MDTPSTPNLTPLKRFYARLVALSMLLPSIPSYRPGKPSGNHALPANVQAEIMDKAKARRERRAAARDAQRRQHAK